MDAEKVKKVVDGLEHCAERSKCDNECPYSDIIQDQNEGMDGCITQLSKDALDVIRGLQDEIPKWIPVEERFPEENISPITHDYTEVVCYTTFGDVRVYKFGEGHFFKGPGVMDHLVTHWQYLPTPPKAGEQE